MEAFGAVAVAADIVEGVVGNFAVDNGLDLLLELHAERLLMQEAQLGLHTI